MRTLIVMLILLCNCLLTGQVTPRTVNELPNDGNYYESLILKRGNTLHLFYFWQYSLWTARSTNNGSTWESPSIKIGDISNGWRFPSLSGAVMASGTIIISCQLGRPVLFYSDDVGNTWNSKVIRAGSNTLQWAATAAGNITRHNDSLLTYIYTRNGRIFKVTTSDKGTTWSNEDSTINILSGALSPNLIFTGATGRTVIYEAAVSGKTTLLVTRSTNSGLSWSAPAQIFFDTTQRYNPRPFVEQDGTIHLLFESVFPTRYSGETQRDIFHTRSTDGGVTWYPAERLTNYSGNDDLVNVSLSHSDGYITFRSDRYLSAQKVFLWKFGTTNDLFPPPVLYYFTSRFISDPQPGKIIVRAKIDDNDLTNVRVIYQINQLPSDSVLMKDDGLSGDSLANDGIYGAVISGLSGIIPGDRIGLSLRAYDAAGNVIVKEIPPEFLPIPFEQKIYPFTSGDLLIPIDNKGVIGDVTYNGSAGGKFKDKVFLFSGGFSLSGLDQSGLWANAVLSASRLEDYIPGVVGNYYNNPRNNIYAYSSQELPFGESWQNYRYAVDLGAQFYDGNNNNQYDPVDLNNNGQWDANEDRPPLNADITAYTVFNDAVAPSMRRYSNVSPKGIEVHQTLFAWSIPNPYYRNIVFIKYRLINKGTVSAVFDSVYFSTMSDPDMSDYGDDFVGCDTSLMGSYAYEKDDTTWGFTEPAFMHSYLQLPYTYVPGETYTDVNQNGLYDEGVDISLSEITVREGQLLGTKTVKGARYAPYRSFTQYMSSHPTNGDPNTPQEMRYYHHGALSKVGIPLNVCTWAFGNGISLPNCASINPRFMYSGYPETNSGWLNTTGVDQRMMNNAGPFRIEKNKPVDIVIAYLIGQGNSATGSVAAMREVGAYARDVYNSNFTNFTTGVNEVNNGVPSSLVLENNYPNPFNSSTVIKFTIPSAGRASLTLYSILGEKIQVISDEYRNAGRHSVQFSSGSLPSGVYILTLESGDQAVKQKLMLMK